MRWILILLGVLLIAAVYFIGRRRQNAPSERYEPRLTDEADEELLRPPAAAHTEPLVQDGWLDTDGHEDDVFDEPFEEAELADPNGIAEAEPEPQTATTPGEQKIIAVRVAARMSTRFRGEDVIRLLNEEGLEFGRFDIFHRRAEEAGSEPVFSVASMIEPGTFDLDAGDAEQLPGVTLFMVLPGPCDGITALDDMLGIAHRLADQLNGEVLDQSGSTLSRQRASNLRDEIIGFQHHLAVLQRHTPSDKGRRRFF
ncbi:MAG: cell division protein ZipA [Gammaproteobacteria bacterium]